MNMCIRCKRVKFGFQFVKTDEIFYTAVHNVCKKCAKELGVLAAITYIEGKTND